MGRYPQEDDNYAGAWKKKKVRPKKRWLDITREDKKEYNNKEDMADNRSVWHMKIEADLLLYGGGLYVREVR